MGAGEEIDLTGLGMQIESVSKEIERLNKNISISEKEVDNIANKNSSMYVKALKDNIKSMGDAVGEMSLKLKDGKDGVSGFLSALKSFMDSSQKIKGIGALPMTDLMNSISSMKAEMSSIVELYSDAYLYEAKLAEANKKRLDILNGVVEKTRMAQEREARMAENAAYSEKIAKAQEDAEERRMKIINGEVEITRMQQERNKRAAENEAEISRIREKESNRAAKAEEERQQRYNTILEERKKREQENADFQNRLASQREQQQAKEEARQKAVKASYEHAEKVIERHKHYYEDQESVQKRLLKIEQERLSRAKENAEWSKRKSREQLTEVDAAEKSIKYANERISFLREELKLSQAKEQKEREEIEKTIAYYKKKQKEVQQSLMRAQYEPTSGFKINQLQKDYEEYGQLIQKEQKKVASFGVSAIREEIAANEKIISKENEKILQAEAKRFDAETKIKDAKSAELKITKELEKQQKILNGVAKGDSSAIASYLKQEMSIKRINNALSGLRAAQENCNLATKKGRQEYAKLGQQIKSLEFMLGRNANIAERLSSAFSKSKSMVEQVAMSFGVMTGVFGATNFVKQLYKITAEFQLQQRALGAIIQNTREANVLFKQMQSLAVESPMKFMDLNRYAKQLAAFRIETTNLYDSLKMLGDIAVGVGVDMDRLILAYGQVKAANYLRGQELRQFSEAGVNILGGLQEYYRDTKNINMSINEIFDSVSKRKVLFEDVDAVLKRMTQSGGEFYNMQLIQSQTLYGQLQKLGDLFQISMNNIGNSTSGVLMKIITAIQFLIKHLREVVAILVSMVGASMLNKLIRNFAALRAGAQGLAISLREGWQVARALGATKLTAFTTALWNANAGMVALNAAISIGLVAFSLWMAKHQEQKAKQEEIQRALIEEITEYNRRLSEVRDLEKSYEKDPSFEGRLALLQQLIDKAKEYRFALQIDENITPANINKNFEDAKRQLEEYTKQVLLFKSVLYTTDVKDSLDSLNSVNIEFANATLSAEKMINALSNVYETLSDKQKTALDEIKEIDRAFLENDEEFLKNINYTYGEWQVERIRKLNALSSLNLDKSVYFAGFDVEGLSEAQEKQFDGIIRDLRNFGFKYSQELKKTTEALKPKVEKIISADDFAKLDEDEIKDKIAENAPAILDALNEVGEFAKQNMPAILQKIWNLDDKKSVSVAKVLVEIEEAETNAKNTRLQRFIDDVANSDENGFVKTLTYDIKIEQTGDVPAFVGTAEQAEQQGIINEKKKEELETTMQIVSAVQKTIGGEKEKKKVFDDEYKMYQEQLKMIQRAIAYGLDEQTVLEGINAQLGTSFASLVGAQNVIETILKNGETLAKLLSWEVPETKKPKGRAQSMKSEYQSMIDFVRELNREFDTLRKNFNEKDSAKWAGATNRILSSFEDKFVAMPKKFKKAFQDSLASIDFTSKEGTVQAENIVKGLIDSAKDLTKKEKEELQRAWGEAVGQIKLEAELELKAREDERLKAQVQKMFDDYNLTIELDKLGVDADEVGKLFNIDTKDLLTLERKLESMKEEFVGRQMEKEYRQFMRKIVEINDKANLEMAKKYVKYLAFQYDERAKLEIEYMRKRAEVYALPFDEQETMRILENLQKETQKKLDDIKWNEFRGSDYYIELFEDLDNVSTQAITDMIYNLNELKSSLSNLSPTELKTMTEQIVKLEDTLIKRNPFRELVKSFKELKETKDDTGLRNIMTELLGDEADFKKFEQSLDKSLSAINKKILEKNREISNYAQGKEAASVRNASIDALMRRGEQLMWYDVASLREEAQKYQEELKFWNDKIAKEGKGIQEPTDAEKQAVSVKENLTAINALISSLETLHNVGQEQTELGDAIYASAERMGEGWQEAKEKLEEYESRQNKLQGAKKTLTTQKKSIIALAEGWQDTTGKVRAAFDTFMDNLDYLGGSTSDLTNAWKEFGDTIFDTITGALEMIPSLVTGFTAAGVAINSAMGIIGLIATAIQLVLTLLSSISKIHDAKIAEEMGKVQKSMDRLKKTADELSEAFDNLYNEDRLREFNAATIKTRELYIKHLEEMIRLEEKKKKTDKDSVEQWKEDRETAIKDIQEDTEKLYESLGGFGSAANMKSQAEEWTDAWYEAFKETGDGLKGLEESFDEFLDNLFKRQIMNRLADKYFTNLFSDLDEILATQGGVLGNRDAFTEWMNDLQTAFGGFNEEATEIANAFMQMGGFGGGLEGLTASLQGMTEETAEILAAYLNSVRYYVADNNQLLRNLYEGLAFDSGNNPIVEQLKIVAANTNAISTMFSDIYKGAGHDDGGAYIKVRMG